VRQPDTEPRIRPASASGRASLEREALALGLIWLITSIWTYVFSGVSQTHAIEIALLFALVLLIVQLRQRRQPTAPRYARTHYPAFPRRRAGDGSKTQVVGRRRADPAKTPPASLYERHSGPVHVQDADDTFEFDDLSGDKSAILRNQIYQYWWLRSPATTANAPLDIDQAPRGVSVIRVRSEAERQSAYELAESVRPLGLRVRVVVESRTRPADGDSPAHGAHR
jgi:hypothetical protein